MGFLAILLSSVVGPVLDLVNEATLPKAMCAMGPLGTPLSQLWESLIWTSYQPNVFLMNPSFFLLALSKLLLFLPESSGLQKWY